MRYHDIIGCSCTRPQQIEEAAGDEDTLAHLVAKYHEFNGLYFEGKLPTIPLGWGRMKNSGAHVDCKFRVKNGVAEVLVDSIKMTFSNKYKRDAVQLEPILLHEMIHVYMFAVLNDVKENHGPKFMAMLSRLSKASGIDIPRKDEAEHLELSDTVAKPVGVILRRYTYGGEPQVAYAMFSAKTLINVGKIADMEKRFTRRFDELVEARIVTSSIWWEKSQRQATQRNIDHKTKFFIPKPEELEDLLANSRVIWQNGGSMEL